MLWCLPYNFNLKDRYPASFSTVYDWIDALEIFHHHGRRLVRRNHRRALREATRSRLRPILLTSLTTVAGLLPITLNRSFQAQFLIPMATSITFGLAFTTVLALFWLPAMLSLYESAHLRLMRLLGRPAEAAARG